jgi:NADPH:quinone reductase-like Zn-dependent oxidoreductase
MKAFVVEHYGNDGLRAADVPAPEVGDADVLVKVSAGPASTRWTRWSATASSSGS